MLHQTRSMLWGTGNALEEPKLASKATRGERYVGKVAKGVVGIGAAYVAYQFYFRAALPSQVRKGQIVAKPAGADDVALGKGNAAAIKGEDVEQLSSTDLVGKLQAQSPEQRKAVMVDSLEPSFINNKRDA